MSSSMHEGSNTCTTNIAILYSDVQETLCSALDVKKHRSCIASNAAESQPLTNGFYDDARGALKGPVYCKLRALLSGSSSCACSYLWCEADGLETLLIPCGVRVAQRARMQESKSKSQDRLRLDYCHFVPACCQYGCQPQLGPEWQLVLPDVNTRPAASPSPCSLQFCMARA